MKKKLTQTFVKNTKPKTERYAVWDTEISGFGLRVSPTGAKSFVLKYTNLQQDQKFYTIGKFGNLTVDKARKEAQKQRGLIASGKDPQTLKLETREAITIKELCEEYIKNGCDNKKPSTISTDLGRIKRHIIPLLGSKPIKDLRQIHITKFYNDVSTGKTACDIKTIKRGRAIVTGGVGTANRTLGLFGAIVKYAVTNGYIVHNPYIGIKRKADNRSERFLDNQELKRLSNALENAGDLNVYAIQAIKLLMLTGCRRGEILNLKWSEIDFENSLLKLEDTKTGASNRSISDEALSILAKIARIQDSAYVFPGTNPNKPYAGIQNVWNKIRSIANLEDVRLHDLRHTFASISVNSGESLAIISKMLGHKDLKTTQRYAHVDHEQAKKAADTVSTKITKFFSSSD